MHGIVHRLIVLATLLLAAVPARGQFDTCFTFAEITSLYPYSIPPGWTIVHGNSFSGNYSNDAYITSYGYTSVYSLYLSPNTDFYVTTPYLAADFSTGAFLQYLARNNCYLEVGTMTNPADPATFHPLPATPNDQPGAWDQYLVDLSGAPVGDHYISFHKNSNANSSYIANIRVSTDGCLVGNLRTTSNLRLSADGISYTLDLPTCDTATPPVEITWDALGNPEIEITIYDSIQQIFNHTYTGVDTISMRFDENLNYGIVATINCYYDNSLCPSYPSRSINILLQRNDCDSSDCIDTRMIASNKATPFYGTYDNPYSNIGAVDFGPSSSYSRHTVNTDTSMFDYIIPQLRVIPEGEDYSVRLGNWQAGSKAEAMQYDILVDTTQFDILILKYAAIMEDPNHDSTNQPRFRIEMLDSEGNLISPASCNSYDFVASSVLGWNTSSYGFYTVLWKDWTVVGIDLSDYHGQMVRLRLTTYDCSLGAHFGYAYYTLSCAQKTILFQTCQNDDSNHVAAPDGFTYRWYRDGNNTTIGTGREITLPIDNHYYHCDLGFIGNPSCSVTLSVLSRYYAPVADFAYTVQRDSCRFKVSFTDRSHLANDTATQCDYTMWDFGALGTSTLRNPVVYFPDTGTYSVKLFSSLNNSICIDSTEQYIVFSFSTDTVDTAICQLERFTIGDTAFSVAGTHHVMIG